MKQLIGCAVCAVASSLFAADVSLQTSGYYFNAAGGWSAGTDHVPTVGNDYWVSDGLTLRTPNEGSNKGKTYTFAGDSLNLGAADGSSAGTLMIKTIGTSKSVVNNLCVYNGKIYTGSEGTGWLQGACAIQPGATLLLDGFQTGAAAGKYRNVNFALTVTGDESSTLAVRGTRHDTDADGLPLARNTFTLGNLSAFKGVLSTGDYGLLDLNTAGSFGDTASPRTNAVTVCANGILRIRPAVETSAARGLSVESGVGYLRVAAAEPVSLAAPVSGKGTLMKIEDGAVTFDGAFTAAGLSVRQGTVLIGPSGSVDPATAVTVASGCAFGGNMASVAGPLALAAGTTLRIAYDSATGVSAPYAPAGAAATEFVAQTSWPISVTLDGDIALPTDGGDIPLVKLPKTAKVLAVSDFTNAFAEANPLPRSAITVTDDPDDPSLQVVSLTYEKVVAFVSPTEVRGLNALKSLDGNSFAWSDELTPHSDADYFCDNASGSGHGSYISSVGYATGSLKFGGKSLLLAANSQLTSKHKTLVFPELILAPGSTVKGIGWSDSPLNHEYAGTITVCGTEASPAVIIGTSKYGYDISATLIGHGALRLTKTGSGICRLKGDNSSFAGSLAFSYENLDTASIGTIVRVSSPAALGGELAAFNPRALVLEGASLFQPDASMTLETANRGIYVTHGGFLVPNGMALTVKEPLRVNGELLKAGDGTLILGGALTFGKDGTSAGTGKDNVLTVRDGSVAALSDAAFAGFATTFEANGGICLKPGAALVNGLTGAIASTETIRVWLDRTDPIAANELTLPICTVPDGTTLAFDLQKPLGFSVELVTETVTLDDRQCVRYSARYVRSGLRLIVR